MPAKRKCRTCSSTKIAARGLCHRCYVAAKATVARGEATDEELVSRNLIDPPKRSGRPAQSGFAKAFAKK